MNHELRTLLWLQVKLLRNSLRRGSMQDTGRLLTVIMLSVLALPGAIVFAIGMGYGLHVVDLKWVDDIVATVFSFMMLMWVVTPVSSQQITEALDLPKLFHLPLSFRNLALGSLLISTASLGTLITLPFLGAVTVGASRNLVHIVPLALSSSAFLGVLIVLNALLADVLDLAAEDRRLRMILIMVSMLPVVFILYAEFSLQARFINDQNIDPLKLVEALQPMRWLRWLPSGWYALAVVGTLEGAWAQWLAGTAGMVAFVGLGLALHVGLMRQLFFGNLLRSAAPRQQKTAKLHDARRIPFLPAQTSSDLAALWRKDWLNFRRSPMTARLFFLPLLIVFMAYFLSIPEVPSWALGLGVGGFSAIMTALMAHNQICTYDHVGVGSLALSPAPRHLVLLSYALLNLMVVAVLALIGGAASAVRLHEPGVVLIAIGSGVLAQIALNGLAHLTSLVFPYYLDLERGQASMNESKTSFFTVFSIFLGAPIVVAPLYLLLVLTALLARPWLPLAFVFGLIYVLIAYAALLYAATRLFPQREQNLVEKMLARR